MTDDVLQVVAPIDLVSATTSCRKCKGETPVVALEVAAMEDAEVPEDGKDDLIGPLFLMWPHTLPAEVLGALAEHAPDYVPDYSHTYGDTIWVNHCTHCGALQGDHYLLGPSGAFDFMEPASWTRRRLVESGTLPYSGGYRL